MYKNKFSRLFVLYLTNFQHINFSASFISKPKLSLDVKR